MVENYFAIKHSHIENNDSASMPLQRFIIYKIYHYEKSLYCPIITGFIKQSNCKTRGLWKLDLFLAIAVSNSCKFAQIFFDAK